MTGGRPPDPHRASLDDLLGVDLDGLDPGSRARLWWLWRDLGFALVMAAVAWLTLSGLGVAVPYLLLVTVLMTAALVRRTVGLVTPPPLPPVLTGRRPDALPTGEEPVDGLFLATGRWNTRLGWTERDPNRFALAIQPRLVQVVDERLRLRHGVTRASDPARARQLLGEQLWSLANQPVAGNPTPGDLAVIIARMEAL